MGKKNQKDNQAVHQTEKTLIEVFTDAADGCLLNRPPKEPYFVDTMHPILATELGADAVWVEDADTLSFRLMNVHIEILAQLTEHQAARLISGLDQDGNHNSVFDVDLTDKQKKPWTVRITYPLSCNVLASVELKDSKSPSVIAIGSIAWAVAQAYRLVYADPLAYGIWGHAMGDLVISGLMVDSVNMQISAIIDS